MHGSQFGSVDREHNGVGGRLLAPHPQREAYERQRMVRGAVRLDAESRTVVLAAIREVCRHQGWALYAAHIRATHVHIVVEAEPSPEHVMGKLKAYASRALNRHSGQKPKRWTRHGSTRRLWSPGEVDSAVQYVVHRQGDPMAVYEKLDRWSFLAIPGSKR